ncbi:MAG TPA: helix-turn-helix transcriptional regulator [Thermoanaerobaculia bacterium]|nr:helix-turn-helix transcriptional regulator [Thermoanaerobaculia bacterium]
MIPAEPALEGHAANAARLAVVLLRHVHGQSQRQLEAASGVDQKRISRYELGLVTPRRPTLERLAAAVGISPARLDQLLALCGQICAESAAHRAGALSPSFRESPSEGRESGGGDLPQAAAEVAESLEPLILQALAELQVPALPPLSVHSAAEERDRAAELWRRLEPLTDRQRRLVIEHGREYRTGALCERLCAESRAAESSQAVELAEIALTVAERIAGPEPAQAKLEAYALAALADAYEGNGYGEEAAEIRRRAEDLWPGGAPTGLAPS